MGCTSSGTTSALPGGGSTAPGSTPGSQGSGGAASGKSGATVTVESGGRVVCVIKISAGKGNCTVNSLQFKPGTAKFTGVYSVGGAKPSGTATGTLTVLKAPTTTSLSLAAATVKYGSEQSEQLSVHVAPKYSGVPAGTVTVHAGGTVVCTVKLASGAGSCRLAAQALAPGSYHLVASYGGGTDFDNSASAQQSLSVSK
jgi:hypothetical protein